MIPDGASAARVKRYAPGLRQAAHDHDAAHLSLVLAGAFAETEGWRGKTVAGGAGQAGLRPEGIRHAVEFGGAGAVILTFAPPKRPEARGAVRDPAWSRPLPREDLRRLVPLLLEGRDTGEEAAWDLLALCAPPASQPRSDPWLRRLREQLIEAPAGVRLTDLAHGAGRHRVHAGRVFLATYGETPSVFRRRAMLDRALGLIANGSPAAFAALDAGFADQSHFSRACRDMYGLPPRRLLARAA